MEELWHCKRVTTLYLPWPYSPQEGDEAGSAGLQRPFTFRHRERPNAPGTLLKEAAETNMRAWDFTTGEAYLSASPIVFSFSTDARQK